MPDLKSGQNSLSGLPRSVSMSALPPSSGWSVIGDSVNLEGGRCHETHQNFRDRKSLHSARFVNFRSER
jgi:hypothetical protein